MAAPTILIVDDDLATCDCLKQIFQAAGYSTVIATTGSSATSAIRATIPAVVVADFRLPDMTGIELLERERARGNRTPFIIVTGFGSGSIAANAFKSGAADYLEKPVDAVTLVRAVEQVLRITVYNSEDHGGLRGPVNHAALRLAALIVPVLALSYDPKTLALWGREVGVSEGALRTICYTSNVSPKNAHRFARVLRVVYLRRHNMLPEELLDVVDLRTLERLIRLGSGQAARPTSFPMTIDEFICRQQWITDEQILNVVKHAILEFVVQLTPIQSSAHFHELNRSLQ